MSRQYRGNQGQSSDHSADVQIDLENQFIMRLPVEVASSLREAIKSGGGNLRERLSIKLEPDKTVANQSHLRRGVVKFDNFELSAKLVDLPTIIESQKTIDRKTFYKTADICQLLICKEGEPSEDEEEPPEKKKPAVPNKDPSKVEKKYLYPHGVCPPLKNVRKRRFRKVLRKNFAEAPEVEKEVKHLLRVDNEAVDVKWELITEEELNAGKSTENATSVPTLANVSGLSLGDETAIDESDLFGALSESEDDEPQENIDVDSEGEMYGDDNEPSSSNLGPSGSSQPSLVTEFRKEMFQNSSQSQGDNEGGLSHDEDDQSSAAGGENAVAIKLEKLESEISQLQRQKEELLHNINNCDNQALLQRFRDSLTKVETDIRIREMDIESFSMFS